MADFVVKRGDRLPLLAAVLTDKNNAPAAIPSSATVQFFMRAVSAAKDSTPLISAAAVPDPDQTANPGRVVYIWATGDTDTPGDYFAEWRVTYTDGKAQTFPTDGFVTVKIADDLESHIAGILGFLAGGGSLVELEPTIVRP